MSDQQLLSLHGRLIAGHLQVASQIVELALPRVVRFVKRQVGALHDHQDAEEAALDAMLAYLKDPARYDPTRAQLVTYLCTIAKNKALNIVRADERRAVRDTRGAEEMANDDDADFETTAIERVELDRMATRWAGQLIKDDGDQAVLTALREGGSLEDVRKALGLPEDAGGTKDAKMRIERLRGRARRIGEGMQQ